MRKCGLAAVAGAGVLAMSAGSSFATTVYQAIQSPANTQVTVGGVVADVLNSYGDILLEDNSGPGGMTVGLEGYSPSITTLAVGDDITLSGSYAPYGGNPEISDGTATLVDTTGTVPPPNKISVADLTNPGTQPNSGQDSIYAITVDSLDNATFGAAAGGTFASQSYTVADSSNPSITGTVYVPSGSPLIGTTVPSGDVDIYGYFNEYRDSVEFDPIGANAITPAAVPEPISLAMLSIGAGSLLLLRRSR